MTELKHLFKNNQKWAKEMAAQNPEVFENLSKGQSPKYLWIGCSDSRVSPTEILNLEAGDIFVHRNIANLIHHTDLNMLSVLQYAVQYLKVQHVIVCGHYGCGGVQAAMENNQLGLMDNWLQSIRDVYHTEKKRLDQIQDSKLEYQKLIELNVIHQVSNICRIPTVQIAWEKGAGLTVHGWIYDISSGHVKDLNCSVSSLEGVEKVFQIL